MDRVIVATRSGVGICHPSVNLAGEEDRTDCLREHQLPPNHRWSASVHSRVGNRSGTFHSSHWHARGAYAHLERPQQWYPPARRHLHRFEVKWADFLIAMARRFTSLTENRGNVFDIGHFAFRLGGAEAADQAAGSSVEAFATSRPASRSSRASRRSFCVACRRATPTAYWSSTRPW